MSNVDFIMRRITEALMIVLFATVALWASIIEAGGAVSVRGYTRSNGTYVAPHYRSAPDGVFGNNWSTFGNINPHTGKPGILTSPSHSTGSTYAAPVQLPNDTDSQQPVTSSKIRNNHSNLINQLNHSLPDHAKIDYSGRSWECIRGYKRDELGCTPVFIPPNAKLNYFGNEWECNRDFKKVSNTCTPVIIPENAKLDYFGHEWECDRGFVKRTDHCLAVSIPNHAKLDYFGHNWECERGYRQSGNTCAAVIIPANAKLDYFGHNWECDRGYKKSDNQCVWLLVPKNARLDYFGHNWECDAGYRKTASACLLVRVP